MPARSAVHAAGALLLLATSASALVPDDLYDRRDAGIGDLSPDGRVLIYTVSAYDRDAAANRYAPSSSSRGRNARLTRNGP